MSPDQSATLKLVSELADDRSAADRRFRLGIAAARAAGLSVAEIAQASRLSTSRVNAILEESGSPLKPISDDEVGYLLENAFTVGLVPAGRLALTDYEDYGAYICQPRRSFRSDMERVGFYARAEISPHFPLIRKSWESVPFKADEVARLRSTGDPLEGELSDVIERILALPDRGGHEPGAHKVLLLTPPDHPDTLSLPQPVKHLVRGRGQAFVRKQRYTTLAALKREPKTTAELVRFERT